MRNPLTIYRQRRRAASSNAAADPATPKADDPAKAAEDAKPTEEAKPADEAAKAAWTPAEDVALISLKAQNKTWKEIGDVLVGREREELRLRFKEIGGVGSVEGGEAAKEGGAAAPVAQSNEGKGNKGKQKGDGGKKGKGKQGDAKGEGAKTEPAVDPPGSGAAVAGPTAAVVVHPAEAVVADKTDSQIKGILKRGSDGAFQFENVKIPEGITKLNGSPVIYVDENDPLDIRDAAVIPLQHELRIRGAAMDPHGFKVFRSDWQKDRPRVAEGKAQKLYVGDGQIDYSGRSMKQVYALIAIVFAVDTEYNGHAKV